MFQVLTHNILPVFAMLALGFGMGRTRNVAEDEARVLNRIAFLVLQPPLIFHMLNGLDLSALRLDAVGLYFACEILGFLIAQQIARRVFRLGPLESWLLGMTMVFVNSLLYIWPISVLIYGEAGAQPISAVVALDASVTFGFFIVSMEIMAGDRATGHATRRILRNPVLIAIVLGLGLNLLDVPMPEPVLTAARFAGLATAPVTLFALGVILSGHSLKPTLPIAAFTGLKLFAFPALVLAAFALVSPGNDWRDLFVLNAAGPSGAMAFALALLYRTKTDIIAPVIIWTSLLSLATLAWLA